MADADLLSDDLLITDASPQRNLRRLKKLSAHFSSASDNGMDSAMATTTTTTTTTTTEELPSELTPQEPLLPSSSSPPVDDLFESSPRFVIEGDEKSPDSSSRCCLVEDSIRNADFYSDGLGLGEGEASAGRKIDREENADSFPAESPDRSDSSEIIGKEFGGSSREKKKKVTAKRRNEADKEEKKAKKSKTASSTCSRKLEKERKAYLELLHAESQRILRETRDASFEEVQGTKKSVSSVLEKIRARKLQLMGRNSSLLEDEDPIGLNLSSKGTKAEEGIALECEDREQGDSPNKEGEQTEEVILDPLIHQDNDLNKEITESGRSIDNVHEHQTPFMATGVTSKNDFRLALIDTQDMPENSRSRNGDIKEDYPASNFQEEEHFTPSILAMNLELDSAPQEDDDESCDEDDKENVDPVRTNNRGTLLIKGDPVKAFVDEEAAEEVDSDEYMQHCDDSEDDAENEEQEELKDLIVTGEEEKPIDRQKRDELHQKWLADQDAFTTENLLQKLNYKQAEAAFHVEESDDEMDENFAAEGALCFVKSTKTIQKNSKKPKLDLSKIFVDKEETYMSSEEEESEQELMQQLVHKKSGGRATCLSSVADERSEEVFSRIKKLNIAPSTKRPKPAPSFSTSVIRGNPSSSSKSSFVGRNLSNSLHSSNKQGSRSTRSFIFGRDDSNSRSSLSVIDTPDVDSEEQCPQVGNASLTLSASQITTKGTKQGYNSVAENAKHGLSLFEILRRSSSDSDCGQDVSISRGHGNLNLNFDSFKIRASLTSEQKVVRKF